MWPAVLPCVQTACILEAVAAHSCTHLSLLGAVLQSTWKQLCNFACEYPEDEKLLMDTFKAQGVRSNAVTIRPSAALPAGDAARFKDFGVLCTLDEVRRMSCCTPRLRSTCCCRGWSRLRASSTSSR